jgi:hypothetical protein
MPYYGDAQVQIEAAEARRRAGIEGRAPITNPGFGQRTSGPHAAHPQTGELLAAPIVGVSLWSSKRFEGDAEHTDLMSRRGGHMIAPVDGPDGIVGYRCARLYRGRVLYDTLDVDEIDWSQLAGSGGEVEKRSLGALVRAMHGESAHPSRGRRVSHSAALMEFERVLGER